MAGDARQTRALRGDPPGAPSGWRSWVDLARLAARSDAFAAQLAYRLRGALVQRGVPLLPRLLHRVSMAGWQVCIGDPVVIGPGLYLPHGQVVIDGVTEIGESVVISPWVTIGLQPGDLRGPTIGANVHIGTGAKLLGPVTIGDGARIGANSVVLDDVPARSTAVGAPARVL